MHLCVCSCKITYVNVHEAFSCVCVYGRVYLCLICVYVLVCVCASDTWICISIYMNLCIVYISGTGCMMRDKF